MGSDGKHLFDVREVARRADLGFWVPRTEEQFQEALGSLAMIQHGAITHPLKRF